MSDEQKLAELLSGPTKPRSAPVEPDPTEEIETVTHEDAQKDGPPAHLSRVTASNLFRHPDAHPVVLDLYLLRKYGHEWYGWEPETLELRIPRDFHDVSDLVMAKIQAVKALHLVDTYWQQWEIFLWCTMAFNGVFPDFETMQVPTVAQCAVSVDIANQLRNDVEWSSEVKAFIASVHHHDDILVAEPPLDFVHVDAEGAHVSLDEVRVLWPAVKKANKMPAADTAVAEQLRRMLIVERAVEESRVSLRSQLPLVTHV